MKQLSNGWKLAICILICEGTGIISGFIGSAYNNEWFDQLQKPSWNPPGYIFGPVWTILYLLMAIALWMVWKSNAPEPQKKKAEWLFAVQLFLNFWWSILFFRFEAPSLAFADILLMIIAILFTIFQFAKISKTAAWLLVPYISWVCFASLLNYEIRMLN